MKCMVISYIKSEALLDELECLLEYRKFGIIESNQCFRVFQGDVHGRIQNMAESLNKELADATFDVEDSLFIVYPTKDSAGFSSLANIVIKRKGNKHLRTHNAYK
ncbi:MAG: hypothetical protein ABUT20_19055 [Bacteroidota bacterium]